MEDIQNLERRGAITLLIYFAAKGKRMISDLMRDMEGKLGQTALYNAIKDLKEINLLKEERDRQHNRRFILLTDKGERAASIIQELIELLRQE